MEATNILGLMSGTSLDGLDIAICSFEEKDGQWSFEIGPAKTYKYTSEFRQRLIYASALKGRELFRLENQYSKMIAGFVQEFIEEFDVSAELIAAHGHTVFHEPREDLTFQMLDGSLLAESTRIPVVCDFRRGDIALGGQGAPLAPLGDELLFPKYSYCLNLGGIANVTDRNKGKRMAYDICPANMALNDIVKRVGKEYDEDGNMARQGKIHHETLRTLNSMDFYKRSAPKSMGRQYYLDYFRPILEKRALSVEDELRTVVEHVAMQVSAAVTEADDDDVMLATGGGALNKFLVECIREHLPCKLEIPDEKLVTFKESLLFAFFGKLRIQHRVNVLAEYTGASRNSSGGAIYYPASEK